MEGHVEAEFHEIETEEPHVERSGGTRGEGALCVFVQGVKV